MSNKLAPYRDEAELNQAQQFLAKLQRFEVVTEDDYRTAGNGLKYVKETLNTLETKRKTVTDPLNAAKREVDGWFRELRTPYEAAEAYLKRGLLDYQAKQMAERSRIAEELKASAGDVPKMMQLAVQAQETIPVKLQGVVNKTVKKWRVSNIELVPRQLMVIDEAKVTGLMHEGVEVPGISYFEEQQLSVRV